MVLIEYHNQSIESQQGNEPTRVAEYRDLYASLRGLGVGFHACVDHKEREVWSARARSALRAGFEADCRPANDDDRVRMVDVDIADDMLTCIDSLRWGKADLYKLIPDGDKRIQAMCAAFGLK